MRSQRVQWVAFLTLPCVLYILFPLRSVAVESDWPSFQQNGQRNAYSTSVVQPETLAIAWKLESSQPPQPAWHGPAKWDAWANLRDLHSMRNYDPVFHVTGAENRVYYGSSLEHCVHCVDAESGERQWTYFVNGPVRIPPTYADGRLYFGADDGNAYCINAMSGKLIWKYSPVDVNDSRWIVNNGNYIPLYPIRTGITVDNGTAYFAASLLPWNATYLCALDAKSGKVGGKGHYVREYEGLTLEGAFAITSGVLIAPQGRVSPILFSRKNGDQLGSLSGGGGAFVVVSGEEVLHGPGNKTGWLTRSNARSRDLLATHKNARSVVVVKDTSYLLTSGELLSLSKQGTKMLWEAPIEDPLALIGVGDYLFAGSVDEVRAFDRHTGEECWSSPIEGRAFGLSFSNGHLLVSTDTGSIYSFAQMGVTNTPRSEREKQPEIEKTSLEGLVEITPIEDKSLIGRWVFQSPHTSGSKVTDHVGNLDGDIEGKRKLERIGDLQTLILDGTTTGVVLAENHSEEELPSTSLTAEAWVRIDKAATWGGIVGAIQDNGSDERGWLLGYRDAKLSWAVAGVDGAAGLTYVIAPTEFVSRGWHHVVGTYDGNQMRLYVDGSLVGKSDAQQGPIDYPKATPYVIGSYRDSNEDHPMSGRIHEVRVYDRVISAGEVLENYRSVSRRFPTAPTAPEKQPQPFLVTAGPWLRFAGNNEAIVQWHTDAPTATRLKYRLDEKVQTIVSDKRSTEHEARLTDLKHNRVYDYTIEVESSGLTRSTAEYECDTFFNYRVASPLSESQSVVDPELLDTAQTILARSGVTKGLCIDLDMRSGDLARALVQDSELRVIGLTYSSRRADALRRQLQSEGLYGTRIVVLEVEDRDQIPCTPYSANLVVCEASFVSGTRRTQPVRQAQRLLAPRGKALFKRRGSGNGSTPGAEWLTFTGQTAEGAGEWTHAYGAADNTAFGNESLSGATKQEDLAVQWIGRPGPRYQSDRSGRKPPPLSAAGRLYLQGLHRIIAVDTHNGTVLWSLEAPHFERVNMPRDCSNWCADDDHVYAAVRDRCWKIDGATGEVLQLVPLPTDGLADGNYEWGYVASVGDTLLGSSMREGSDSTSFWGGPGWYDGIDGEAIKKVCSDRLFAIDKASGKKKWVYDGAVVLNSTITVGTNRMWFVESRHPAILSADERRIGAQKLYDFLHLVAVDINTGKSIWDKPLDVVTPDVALTLAYGQGRLALVGSNSQSKSFHIYNFADDDGYQAWSREVGWGHGKNDHGTHLSRPAIVGSRLIVRPGVMNLATGDLADVQMPVSGCGTYACTSAAMLFRSWSGQDFAMWDFETGDYTRWPRLRPDCWLSAIPADGLLLAPEGGGGCSCGSWLETSLAFIPRARLED